MIKKIISDDEKIIKLIQYYKDYEESCKRANELSGYASEREMAIANEHIRETKIFQKVLTKKTKKI